MPVCPVAKVNCILVYSLIIHKEKGHVYSMWTFSTGHVLGEPFLEEVVFLVFASFPKTLAITCKSCHVYQIDFWIHLAI